jgi:hypothetical protein
MLPILALRRSNPSLVCRRNHGYRIIVFQNSRKRPKAQIETRSKVCPIRKLHEVCGPAIRRNGRSLLEARQYAKRLRVSFKSPYFQVIGEEMLVFEIKTARTESTSASC